MQEQQDREGERGREGGVRKDLSRKEAAQGREEVEDTTQASLLPPLQE